MMVVIVKRLNSHSVASQDQLSLSMIPNGNGEHPAEMGKTILSPMEKGIQDNFGIASGLEGESMCLQFPTKLLMIEYLAIENHDDVAIRTMQRLIALRQVMDAKSGSSERNII